MLNYRYVLFDMAVLFLIINIGMAVSGDAGCESAKVESRDAYQVWESASDRVDEAKKGLEEAKESLIEYDEKLKIINENIKELPAKKKEQEKVVDSCQRDVTKAEQAVEKAKSAVRTARDSTRRATANNTLTEARAKLDNAKIELVKQKTKYNEISTLYLTSIQNRDKVRSLIKGEERLVGQRITELNNAEVAKSVANTKLSDALSEVLDKCKPVECENNKLFEMRNTA